MQSGRKPPNAAARQVYANYLYNAKRRNMFWGLSQDQFFLLVVRPCHYCGRESSSQMKKGSGNFRYNGLDRKSNSRGYELWNVVPCCTRCNSIKGEHLTHAEMLAAMKAIAKLRR